MNHKEKNKGLSLVELIITMSILVIVGGTLLSFIMISIRNYKSSRNEVELQYEAQLTSNQIHDLLIDASAGVSYSTGTATSQALVMKDSSATAGADVKKIYVYDWQDDGTEVKSIVSIITWNKADSQVMFSSYEYIAGNPQPAETTYLLADYVTDFTADLTNLEANNKMDYTITYTVKDRTYTSKNTVNLRNSVLINSNDFSAIFQGNLPEISTVESVEVIPDKVTVMQGDTHQFTAKVYGTNMPSQEVEWSLESGSYSDTANTKIDESGLLTLGSNEINQNIQVIATSIQSKIQNSTNPAGGDAFVQAKHLDGMTLQLDASVGKGFNQKAAMTLTGQNVETDNVQLSYTTTPASGVTVTFGSAVAGTEVWNYSDIAIQCDKNIVGYDQAVSVAITASYGGKSYTNNIAFSTGLDKKALQAVRIVQDAGIENKNINRGATNNYILQIQRVGSTSWVNASVDGAVNALWNVQYGVVYNGYNQYVTLSNGTNGYTGSISVSKNPELLPYGSIGQFSIQATVSDTSGNQGNPLSTTYQNISVPIVTLSARALYTNNVVPGKTIQVQSTITGIENPDPIQWSKTTADAINLSFATPTAKDTIITVPPEALGTYGSRSTNVAIRIGGVRGIQAEVGLNISRPNVYSTPINLFNQILTSYFIPSPSASTMGSSYWDSEGNIYEYNYLISATYYSHYEYDYSVKIHGVRYYYYFGCNINGVDYVYSYDYYNDNPYYSYVWYRYN